MATDLTISQAALERLNRTVEKDSLDDLIKARTRRSLLLLDCSSSMGGPVPGTPERRIDALRTIYADLRKTHQVPTAAFGPWGMETQLIDDIPEPAGGTPLHRGIDFAREQGANHLVLITDGEPQSEAMAYTAAAAFGHPIDVFFIGDETSSFAAFCRELARRTKGSAGRTDLAGEGRKALTGKITLLLGDGKDVL